MLGIDAELYLKAVRRQPTLFHFRPATIAENVGAIIRHFGLPPERYRKCLISAPVLLYSKPATIIARVQDIARLIGCEQADVAQAALIAPTLLLRRPPAIARIVADGAALLEMTPADYTAMALTTPQLLLMPNATMASKLRVLRAIRRALMANGQTIAEPMQDDVPAATKELPTMPPDAATREQSCRCSTRPCGRPSP